MENGLFKKFTDILFSYWTMLLLFALLAGGAGVATFIENDYGTSTARVFVYNHVWYEIVMTLSVINLMGIIYRRKMWRQKARFIFHFSFVVMLIGAGVTRYVGYEGIMHIKEGQTQNTMISLEPYFQVYIEQNGKTLYKEFQKEFAAIGNNDFNYDIMFADKLLNVKLDSYKFAKKGKATMNLIGTKVSFNGEEQVVKLVGQRGQQGVTRQIDFKDNVKVTITYGSKNLTIPFAIRLNDFQLDRYPGSMSPSSFASEVTLIDKVNNKEFDYRIFMNSTLIYGGYQFFQSSYDPDETGTVLSVNNDPGTIPTYIGYFLLALGLLMNMFDKKSRFAKLTQYIKQFNSFAAVAAVACLLYAVPSNAQENTPLEQVKQEDIVAYLTKYQQESKAFAKEFGKLVVQSAGRMKPFDTLNLEVLNKLSRKSTLMGMNPDQVVLGMMSRPDIWMNIKMIKIQTPKLKRALGIDESRDLIAFSEIFENRSYKLAPFVKEANAVDAKQRGTYEKDIIKLDERLNIAYMVFYGDLFRVFPHPDKSMKSTKWMVPSEVFSQLQGQHKAALENMIKGMFTNVSDGQYDEAKKFLDFIVMYQKGVGSDLYPDQSKIDQEILFNKLGIFPKVTLAYVLVGIILFIVSFVTVFNKKWQSPKINTAFFAILAVLFAIQTYGMGMRWYISGHAPWSDTYESLIYIGWSSMFAGLFFFRKSLMALSATVVMAGVFMFTAHLSGIDPQITNLVPVLKSYWLTIHVSIITGSYGFLAIGAMLGFMALLLFIVRDPVKRPHIDDTIKQITAINEAALIIGLAALVVGNFLGGVWANESWGRYWGWDPKETWAYVAIVVYALVLHMRLISKLNTPYILSVGSTLAFSTILMTYFGVNFYLSGMHSYATGDPVPIPMWVYVVTTMVFVVIALASRKRDLPKLKV